MDTQNIILGSVLLANIFLELLLLVRTKNNWSVSAFSISLLAVIFWTFSIIAYRISAPENSVLWAKILYVAAALIPSTFLYFAFLFPSEKFTISRFKAWATALVSFVVIAITLYSNFVIKTVIPRLSEEKIIVFGAMYPIYILYIFAFFGWALFSLAKKYKDSAGEVRTQISYVLIGTIISIIFGTLFNLILPTLGEFRFNWMGQVATLIMVSFISYAIIKKKLFGVGVFLTQLLVAIIAILLFINFFASQTPFEYLWKGAMFIAFLVAGYLLIKSVLQEIKYREQLQVAYEKLKELDKTKSEFISIASHQLRTPLTAIKGYISMMIEGSYGKLNPKQQKPLEGVYQSNERLIKLVNDLLNVSRIDAGKVDMKWEETNLGDLIQGVIDELKIKAEQTHIELRFEPPAEKLPLVRIDVEKIRNVVLNIIDNAIRYTPKGSIIARVQLQPQTVRIAIADTGEGMSQDEIQDLFESFSRGAAGEQLWTEGAGLGLYIAKKFVQMHNGKIWAESAGEGKGSTFFVELPLAS